MKSENDYVFQSDSDLVRQAYSSNNNFIIEYNESLQNNLCVLYFSSNNIYGQNTEESFTDNIILKNKFEWYGTRILHAAKHIFLRDLIKQWYLTGINGTYNSPELLHQFLKAETHGYRVITLGSSSGGFAAVLYGSLLNAEMILTFNGQFEVYSLLKTSNPSINPILFRNKNKSELTKYYDVRKFITNPSCIFYFYSTKSAWDKEQFEYIRMKNINYTGFITSHHGIPFLKCNLPKMLSLKKKDLQKMNKKTYYPLIFSIKMVGTFKTIKGLYDQLKKI
jgi:hypothetical protein